MQYFRWRIKGCGRCGGDQYLEDKYYICINCGHSVRKVRIVRAICPKLAKLGAVKV